mmetsp:Transcript_14682/g.20392  ORF Transcript_14682/g.20392 Transcript_14682/m.20392 type:complete len:171 (+) Transcript_14682:3-515(+)
MPLEILNCSGLPSRAESLLKLCFKFDIEQQDRKTEKPLASWNKHDIVNYIKTFSTNKNKQWNQCIQVILKEDIEYSLLEVSKEEELKDLGIPLLCARTLLRKLNLISKEESSRKGKRHQHQEVIVDTTNRPTASMLLQQITNWSKKDKCEYVPNDIYDIYRSRGDSDETD